MTFLKHQYRRLLTPWMNYSNVGQKKTFYQWLTVVWNRVDSARVKEVGPDQACAEWLLKNGASVRWRGVNEYLEDYDELIAGNEKRSLYIQAVDAKDASISHIGFGHFAGCKYLDEIKLESCLYIENEALRRLIILKDTLKHLEVLDCGNITDGALKSLKNLTNLKILKLRDLPYVKDKTGVENELKDALPNCEIEWK